MVGIGASINYELTEEKIITDSELKLLLKTIKLNRDHSISNGINSHLINDYYLIQIASLTGLRATEISELTIAQIHENSLSVVGKGKRKRSIPLGRQGKRAIKELLNYKSRNLKQSVDEVDCLFLNRLRKPFSRHGVNDRFKYWCLRAGIRTTLSFHSLRHYFATYCLNGGFNLAEVQKMLGHSSIQTTSIYLHFTKKTQERANSIL